MSPNSDKPEGDEESNEEGGDSFKLGPSKAAKHTILYYRSMVVQNMGGLGHQANSSRPGADMQASMRRGRSESGSISVSDIEAMGQDIPKIFMKSPELSVLESAGVARVSVLRMHGNPEDTIRVTYTTKDETAVTGLDYEATEGELVFGPGETSKDIIVNIVDDDMSEPDVVFSVLLTSAAVGNGGDVKLLLPVTTVTVGVTLHKRSCLSCLYGRWACSICTH